MSVEMKYDNVLSTAPLPPPSPEVTTEISNKQLVVTILLFASSTKQSPIRLAITISYQLIMHMPAITVDTSYSSM